MGIQQWMFLFPLLFLLGYQQYKMEFLMKGLVQKTTIKNLWKKHLFTAGIISVFSILGLGLSFIIIFDEVIYLVLIIAFVALYQYFSNRLMSFIVKDQRR
jgi:cytochrome c biogenesis protein CcdA